MSGKPKKKSKKEESSQAGNAKLSENRTYRVDNRPDDRPLLPRRKVPSRPSTPTSETVCGPSFGDKFLGCFRVKTRQKRRLPTPDEIDDKLRAHYMYHPVDEANDADMYAEIEDHETSVRGEKRKRSKRKSMREGPTGEADQNIYDEPYEMDTMPQRRIRGSSGKRHEYDEVAQEDRPYQNQPEAPTDPMNNRIPRDEAFEDDHEQGQQSSRRPTSSSKKNLRDVHNKYRFAFRGNRGTQTSSEGIEREVQTSPASVSPRRQRAMTDLTSPTESPQRSSWFSGGRR